MDFRGVLQGLISEELARDQVIKDLTLELKLVRIECQRWREMYWQARSRSVVYTSGTGGKHEATQPNLQMAEGVQQPDPLGEDGLGHV